MHRVSPATPASGVRSAPEPPATSSYVPPRPAFDSEPELTRVTAPDASLLAMSGKPTQAPAAPSPRPSRFAPVAAGFLLGALVGGGAVWALIGDVEADVYRARAWAAEELRALRAPTTPDEASAPPLSLPASASAAPPPAAEPVPTADVNQLPRAVTPPPGAPTLTGAPGPR